MIPTISEVKILWDRYDLPEYKRYHVMNVAAVAVYLAGKLREKGIHADIKLLEAAALLHDIDKNIPKLPGEKHPDAGVRTLIEEGMVEVAELVRRHPLHTILDPKSAPDSWEAKLLYLSDKMVKQTVISVEERFALWNGENLPPEARKILKETYPLVKRLEQEVFSFLGITPAEVAKNAVTSYTR